jgi:Uma2 family endonuclease
MAVQTVKYTIDKFEPLALRPENAGKRLELIEGEIVEVVSNSYSSLVAANIIFFIQLYLRQGGMRGYVTGADGGYRVGDEAYIPDVGFISHARQPAPSHDTYNPHAPDLVVEVLSPTDKPDDVRIKVIHYLAAGTTVWLVVPESKHVEVYTPAPVVKRIGLNGVIDGGDVLPGFSLAVKDIFPD